MPYPVTDRSALAIAAVIFDCDGTLVDSEALGLAAIAAEARALGGAFGSEADLIHLKGLPMTQCLLAVERKLGRPLPADFEATARLRMAEMFRERLQPMPQAAATLAALHVPYCVASNGPRAKTELTLGLTGLLPLFEGRVFSAYDVGSWKPDPGLFLHAAAAMGVAAPDCVVVEDSEPGVRAGLAAGMTVYVLRSAQALPAELAARVQHLDRLSDLIAAPWNRPRA
jgi:HAD superfamily hydrolase (TIGR01509 family)